MLTRVIFVSILAKFLFLTNEIESGLIEFNSMIFQKQKINPGILIGYGYYCGPGNVEKKPVDNIDE